MTEPIDRRRGALASAIEAGIVGKDDESDTAMFMDMDILHATISALKAAPFPPGTLHTFAVKANPVGRVLEVMRDAGLGAEVASAGELRQALACGFPPDRVVFDSPIKTVAELRFALGRELQRVADLVAADPGLLRRGGGGEGAAEGPPRLIGIRINPQVGEGRIAALSTAGRVSKFGVPLLECRTELLRAFAEHPWLNALHLHVGSQGVPLELTVEGVARVAELAEEVEAAAAAARDGERVGGSVAAASSSRRILALDIGGGLPVQYGNDDLGWLLGPTASARDAAAAAAAAVAQSSIFERYAALLRRRLPALFGSAIGDGVAAARAAAEEASAAAATAPPPPPPPQLVTEFGRCLVAKCVFAAGKVEYSKRCGGRRVVVSGLGGDLLLRAVYLPDTWPVRVELYDAAGRPKLGAAAGGSSSGASVSAGGGADGGVECGASSGGVIEDGGTEGAAVDDDGVGPTDVVGPLCFQGDRLAEAVPLPPAHPGDWVVVPDVGAYCLSMYSRYNSRCSPPVWGFWRSTAAAAAAGAAAAASSADAAEATTHGLDSVSSAGLGLLGPGNGLKLPAAWGGGGVRQAGEYGFVLLRRGETVEEVMSFWNLT